MGEQKHITAFVEVKHAPRAVGRSALVGHINANMPIGSGEVQARRLLPMLTPTDLSLLVQLIAKERNGRDTELLASGDDWDSIRLTLCQYAVSAKARERMLRELKEEREQELVERDEKEGGRPETIWPEDGAKAMTDAAMETVLAEEVTQKAEPVIYTLVVAVGTLDALVTKLSESSVDSFDQWMRTASTGSRWVCNDSLTKNKLSFRYEDIVWYKAAPIEAKT